MREGFEYFEETKQLLFNGVILPSVGTIISPVADKYYTDNIPEVFIEEGKRRGKIIHEAIEKFLTLGIIEIEDEKYRGYLDAFMNWYYKVNPEVLEVELVVYTSEYWGILDILVKIKDKVFIIDVKNSAKIFKELIELQLTGYKGGLKEAGIEVDGIMGLHLKKDGKYEVNFLLSREEEFKNLLEKYKGGN